VFNINPFNYYQTPQERTGGMALGRFEINEHAEAYGSLNFNSTKVTQQVAPSGIFGSSFFTPLANPLIGASALNTILTTANAGVAAGTVNANNWIDANSNGVVDAADELRIQYRRRTLEFGERSTEYSNDYFQVVGGLRGDIKWDWTYDFSVSYGNSDRTNWSRGYTNITNIEQALRTTDGVTCENGDTTCVPINLFGGFGSITPAMAGYSSASAAITDEYEQKIYSLVLSGPIEQARLPWASSPLALSFGYEQREDEASTDPDECWKQSPAPCLGGAGGSVQPISGGYKVEELFAEAILPLASDQPFAKELSLEAGYRVSDYDFTDETDTWKYGVNWRPVDSLMIRAMKQRAVRAPNVGELYSPVTTALDNASRDPCSAANPNIDATLRALCISTGMTDAQVGTVENIVAGQINTFTGSDPNNLPEPEDADTVTIGFVWTPDSSAWWDRSTGLTLSIDYYDIDVEGYIDEITPNEVLDGCYVLGQADKCAQIKRVFGTLTEDGSGIETFTTNLEYIQAEGYEMAFSTGVSLGDWGTLDFSGTVNYYTTQEYQSSPTTDVVDCLGRYGASCGAPLPWVRFVQRTTWSYGDYTVSAQWRYFGETQIENAQNFWHPNVGAVGGNGGTFPKFQEIDEFNYLDLFASYNYRDMATLSFGVDNVFAKHPPVVGNGAADTASNSGNTFPSQYDVMGRVYRMGVDLRF
jgi:outer membrane receptor protein involved in Fe transport